LDDPILTSLSEPALIRAIKGNLMALFRAFGNGPGTDFYEDPHTVRWQNSIQHPWFSGVISKLDAPDYAPDIISDTVAYFKQQQTPIFTWWCDPTVDRESWHAYLVEQGFGLDTNTPGMALDLSTVDKHAPLPDGLAIKTVDTPQQFDQWVHTFILGFGMPPDWAPAFGRLMTGIEYDLSLRHYIGYLNGEAVATSTLFPSAGVAGIHNVATLPQARGRGIGTALTHAPLLDALDMGYRVSILQSSDIGYRVYQRMGFKKLCDMEHYFLRL